MTAPSTTQVIAAEGKIRCGNTSATSIQTEGGVQCGAITSSSTFTLIDRSALYPTTFGYSSSYKAVRVGATGATDTTALTVAIGVDPATVAGDSFAGAGGEILLGRNMILLQPNSVVTDWERAGLYAGSLSLNATSDGALTVAGRITARVAVPGSFADLAAVRTWLAANFT